MGSAIVKMGYRTTVENTPGVWVSTIEEKKCRADVLRISSRSTSTDSINSGIMLSNQFSIISSSNDMNNISNLLYIEYMGTRWRVSYVEFKYPRMIVNVGGVYNG